MSKRVVVPWVLVVLLAAGVLVLLFRGCGKGPVAVVNGVKIKQDEFYARLEKIAGQQVLHDMITREMFDQEAAAQGIVVTQEQVDAELEGVKARYANPADFYATLASHGQTEEELRDEIAYQLRLKALLTKGVKVTEEEARAYFEKHRSDPAAGWDQPELYHFLEIVLDTPEEAKEALARAREPDADFQALSRSLSKSQITRPSGGDYGTAPMDRVFPVALRPVLAEMKDGEIRGPIGPASREDGEQYWVIKLLSKKPPVKASFEDPKVRQQAMERVRMEKAKRMDELFAELKNKYRVHILWPEYQFMNEQFRGEEALPEFGAPTPTPPPTPTHAPPPTPPANAPEAATPPENEPAAPPDTE